MPVTLKEINRWLVLKQRVDAPQGDAGAENERANAHASLQQLEAEQPGIGFRARACQLIVDAAVFTGETLESVSRLLKPRGASAPRMEAPAGAWTQFASMALGAAAERAASRLADGLAGEISGEARFDALTRGEFDCSPHECADGQVCMEIRANAVDIRNRRLREQMMDDLERQLVRAAR